MIAVRFKQLEEGDAILMPVEGGYAIKVTDCSGFLITAKDGTCMFVSDAGVSQMASKILPVSGS